MSVNVPAAAGVSKRGGGGGQVRPGEAAPAGPQGRSPAFKVMAPLDSEQFIKLKRRDKLLCLLVAAGALGDAKQILGTALEAPGKGAAELPLNGDADQLLSVLSYVMQVAQYQSEGMWRLWREQNTFCNAVESERPPWASASLQKFLVEQGPPGLQDAVRWIRCH